MTTIALTAKVKTALDETRTLILGAQILLGFQCQSAFQEQFDTLPATSRQLSASALALMLLTIAMLIAPSAFHRVAQDGQSTARMHRLTGGFAALALLPFAAALGFDLILVLERAWEQWVAAVAAGILFGAAAAAGLGWVFTCDVHKGPMNAPRRQRSADGAKRRRFTPASSRC